MKNLLRKLFRVGGYTVRYMGKGVGGVDLLHDARVMLGNSSNPILFDVGANIGQTTQAMLLGFPSPRIRAFEPSPVPFQTLQRSFGNRPNVILEPLGMGERSGNLPFHVIENCESYDSILAPTWSGNITKIIVPVDTVDAYCLRHAIESIDLLKIDTQGYDLCVLKGARQMFKNRRIKLWCCEANGDQLYDQQATLRDLLAFADEIGYQLVGFYNQTYKNNEMKFLDMLFYVGSMPLAS